MDVNLRRRARERAIAAEIANELALSPAMQGGLTPEPLSDNSSLVCEVFGRVCDRHQVVTEDAGARILEYVPKVLAKLNLKFADLNRQLDAAIRQTRTIGSGQAGRHAHYLNEAPND